MEILDFSIEPGAVREIHCQGSYVYFYGGSAGGADATIGVKMDARGERVLLMPGQAFRMEPGQKAQRWIISNHAGQAPITGRLVIGSGQIDDNRVTGSVEVIDGGKNSTLAGLCFSGGHGIGEVADNCGHVILENPAGSTKRLVVEMLNASISTNNYVTVRMNAGSFGSFVRKAGNKLSGGAVSTAKIMELTSIGDPIGGSEMYTVYSLANDQICVVPKRPLIVNPGYSLAIRGPVNSKCTAFFDFYEELF